MYGIVTYLSVLRAALLPAGVLALAALLVSACGAPSEEIAPPDSTEPAPAVRAPEMPAEPDSPAMPVTDVEVPPAAELETGTAAVMAADAAAEAEPVDDDPVQTFIEAFGDRGFAATETSSILVVVYRERPSGSFGGTAEIIGNGRVEGSALGEAVAKTFVYAGLAPLHVHRVDAHRRVTSYLPEFAGEHAANAYVVRAFGDFDSRQAARQLSWLREVLYACHGFCDGPLDPAATPPPDLEVRENDLRRMPEPPVHEGGAPYPAGTIPPEFAEQWQNANRYYIEFRGRGGGGGMSGGHAACRDSFYGYIRDQLIFHYRERPDDPESAITAELRTAGVEFESVTVRTAAHYAQHSPSTFHNWLEPDASGRIRYQVILHGHDGDVRRYRLPSASTTHFNTGCSPPPSYQLALVMWGLYTTFGDDVVFYDSEDVIRGARIEDLDCVFPPYREEDGHCH